MEPIQDDPLREAVRFAEEYGYNRWLDAQDELNGLVAERDRLIQALERIKDAAPQSYDWYQSAARLALTKKETK
jgi:hypothetical protein